MKRLNADGLESHSAQNFLGGRLSGDPLMPTLDVSEIRGPLHNGNGA